MNIKKHFIPFFAIIFLTLLISEVFALTAAISPGKVILEGDIGKTFIRSLIVKNQNSFPVNITLTADHNNIKLSQTKFRLEAGNNQTVPFNLTINQLGTVNESIHVNFKSDDLQTITLTSSLVVTGDIPNGTVNENSSENQSGNQNVLITADLDSQTPNIVEGSDLIINLLVTNIGDVRTDYSVSALNYENFSELLMTYPEDLTLNAGESGNVMMHFHIKDNSKGFQEYTTRVFYGSEYKDEPISFVVEPKFPENMTDIAYVVKSTGSPDHNFINAMNTLGYSYDMIGSSSVSTTDFSQYKMILVGDERISNIPVNNYKSLIANPDYYKNFSQSKASTSNENIYNVNQNTTITQGLDKYFTAYRQSNIALYYLTGTKYNANRVSVKGNSTVDLGRFVIATKDNPRRVFFGITKSNYWSDESLKLFENSLDWIIIGEDADKDSYLGDYDCNDSNPDVWENVLAYKDTDNDGYGTGQLTKVCSGNFLPSGYSYIDGDCNDNDTNIHPNALEIPYDSIDEKCTGTDLADVDSDGYCKAGYVIQNAIVQCPLESGSVGTDCNDMDGYVNPGSDDVFKNCINDAPIISEIDDISVNEGDNATIEVDAVDPENDNITYDINDSRFTKNNNIFTWNTSFSDEGSYVFKVSASDGKLTSNSLVNVIIDNKNRVPVCSDIPPISFDENKNSSINLGNYCTDPDNDSLSYAFYDTLDSSIYVDELNNSNPIIFSNRYWYGEGWIQFVVSDGKDEIYTNQINVTVNHVNQAPEFLNKIANITLYQNTNSTNRIPLDNYFFDRDSNLTYSAAGNNNINIEIKDGLVSFYPALDFYGNESVIFSASDGEFNASSNSVLLNVLYINKPPKFLDMNCPTDLLENKEGYSCELMASDAENDSFSYSVISLNNLNCEISGNNLSYSGSLDYYGNASCVLRVSDQGGHSDFTLNTQIEHVNQPPRIFNHNPISNNIRLLENASKEFSIHATDIDQDNLTINWMIGGVVAGRGNIFNFSKTLGTYNLTAIVSDSEFNQSYSWNVNVGAINDFKCSEVKGYLCTIDQVCYGSILGVYDSANCCSMQCTDKPLEFRNIKREANVTTDSDLELIRPLSGDGFYTGDDIPVQLKIKNDADNTVDYDVYVYLYDYTKQSIVDSARDSFKLIKDTSKTINPSINISRKIKEGDNFYVFAKLVGKDTHNNHYYNEEYARINITRKSDDVVIDNVGIVPSEALCGDTLHLTVKTTNYGTSNEDVVLNIASALLKINQNIPEFSISGYDTEDKSDSSVKEILVKVDDNSPAGDYIIKTSVSYGGNTRVQDTGIVLGECKKQDTIEQVVETTPSPVIKLAAISKTKKPILSSTTMIIITTLTMMIVFVLILISGKVYKNKIINEDKKYNEFMREFMRKIEHKYGKIK